MIIVNSCFKVFNLQLGSLLIALFLIVNAAILLVFGINLLKGGGAEDNESTFEKLQLLVVAGFYGFLGGLIIFGVLFLNPKSLKISALLLLLVHCLCFFSGIWDYIFNGKCLPLLFVVALFSLIVYFVLVLWSFANDIEFVSEEREEDEESVEKIQETAMKTNKQNIL